MRGPGTLRLTCEQLRALKAELRRRQELLRLLHLVSPKALGAKYGVSYRTVTEVDRHLHGYHARQPDSDSLRSVEELGCAAA